MLRRLHLYAQTFEKEARGFEAVSKTGRQIATRIVGITERLIALHAARHGNVK